MNKQAILIDYDWCTGCHSCELACQMELGLPVGQTGVVVTEIGPWEYGEGKWQLSYDISLTGQCNLCEHRTSKGKLPSCVQICQAKCLSFGTVEDLAKEMSSGSKQALITI